jgi:hypothetical protein
MFRVGIIAEGPTDFLVLEEIMKTVTPDIEFLHIHPAPAVSSRLGNGWRGVKAWCQENGPELETYLAGVQSRPLNLLVIHTDCSMADKLGADRPCPPASDTALALKQVIEETWLCRVPLPEFVILATPAMSSDAWVVAAFEEPHPNLAAIECDKAIEDEFVRRKIFRRRTDVRMRNGRKIKESRVQKKTELYGPMAARCGQAIDLVCTHCPQAEEFRSNFRVAVARSLPPEAS